MMIRALNTIALVVAVVLAFALYRAKTEAHAARERLDNLTVLVEEERRASAVLRAEIAFLERPERLRALAARHLGLEPTDPAQETTLEATLLALGEPEAEARYADAREAQAASMALAQAEPAPAADLAEPEAAPVALAEAAPIESEPLIPAPVTRVAEAAPPSAALRPAEDPIAGLIVAVGGMN